MVEQGIEWGILLLLTLLGLTGWVGNLLQMPGNWAIVLLAVLCFWFRSDAMQTHVALVPLTAIIIMAALGELLEFAASALGASRVGGSRRATILAMVGSIGGAIAGLFVGTLIPIPIVGNLLASLMLGAAGAFAGAIAGERWHGKDWDASIEIGNAAFWGRLLGTVGKAVCGTVVCAIFLSAIWF